MMGALPHKQGIQLLGFSLFSLFLFLLFLFLFFFFSRPVFSKRVMLFLSNEKENSARVLISGAPYSAVPSALNVSARVLILAISEECLSSRAH